MRLSRRTSLAGVGLAAAASLVLGACGGGGSDDGDNVITVHGSNPANPLIPTATNEVGGGDPINNLYSGLVAYNTDGSVENEVAESVKGDKASKVWTVKIKDGQKFTDGSPVTSESFVKAWNYGALKANKQLNNYFFYPIKGTDDEGYITKGDSISGLKVIDDKTFTITLKEAESDFPLRLGYSAYFPVPKSAYGSDGKITKEYGNRPIGNGPYKLSKTGWEKNKQISLVPNKDYTGAHKPKNKGLIFKFYTSNESAYTDVQSGKLDVLDQMPAGALKTFEKDDSVKAYNEPGSSFSSFTIPESLKHFGKNEEGRLRRAAISMATNRKEITEKVFNGTMTPAKDFTSPVLDGWTDKVKGNEVLEYNPTEAKKKWAEADKISKWSGSFRLAYNGDQSGNKEYCEAMANQIKNTLGIDAEPKPYATFDEFRNDIQKRKIKTAFRTGWQADYPSMLNYLGPLYATGAGSNDGDYSNKQFDKLVTKAAATKGDERYKLIGQAQSILFRELPALPLWYQNAAASTSKGLKGFKFNWQQKPDYYALSK